MSPHEPYIIVSQSLLDDSWFTDAPLRLLAWLEILARMDPRTGEVRLSRVEVRHRFRSRKAWRCFIDGLLRRGMVTQVSTRWIPGERGRWQFVRVSDRGCRVARAS